jgi:hypothetical protein
MSHSTQIFVLLCLGLATVGCVAGADEPEFSNERELLAHDLDEDENDGSLAAAEPGVQEQRGPSEYAADASCGPEVHVDQGESDWLMDMTAEELMAAPSGYLSVAPLRSMSDEQSDCHAEGVVTVRVADGIAPRTNISSLCIDEQAGVDEMVLRACANGEPSLGDWRMSSLTAASDPAAGACWFCHSDLCADDVHKQRKEGSTGPCIPNFWNTCCWAANAGCC